MPPTICFAFVDPVNDETIVQWRDVHEPPELVPTRRSGYHQRTRRAECTQFRTAHAERLCRREQAWWTLGAIRLAHAAPGENGLTTPVRA